MASSPADNASATGPKSEQAVERRPAPRAARPQDRPSEAGPPPREAAACCGTPRPPARRPQSGRPAAVRRRGRRGGPRRSASGRVSGLRGGHGFGDAAGIAAGDVIAQAVVRAATRSGSSSRARVFDDWLAASGLPIAAQYTMRKASIQARACGEVVCDASSISLFAPVGSARVNSRLVARRKARLARRRRCFRIGSTPGSRRASGGDREMQPERRFERNPPDPRQDLVINAGHRGGRRLRYR